MKFLKYISFLGLGLTLLPSIFVFRGDMSLELHKTLALIGTIIWITTAPFWINKSQKHSKRGEQI